MLVKQMWMTQCSSSTAQDNELGSEFPKLKPAEVFKDSVYKEEAAL